MPPKGNGTGFLAGLHTSLWVSPVFSIVEQACAVTGHFASLFLKYLVGLVKRASFLFDPELEMP